MDATNAEFDSALRKVGRRFVLCPARGERSDAPEMAQSQIAATIAALLGREFPTVKPAVDQPLADALR